MKCNHKERLKRAFKKIKEDKEDTIEDKEEEEKVLIIVYNTSIDSLKN